jgi:hypothetical protein
MQRLILAATYLAVSTVPALAGNPGIRDGNNTAIATGTAKSTSVSSSNATAISGQGGQGGQGGVGVGIGTGGNVTIQGAPANTHTTIENTGTSTVRNVPSVFAPGLSAAGLETCLGSASGGVSVVGFGLTGGSSTPDPNCNARLDARTLWSLGLKKAAVARLCLSTDIYRSMPEVCAQYMPQVQPVGYVVPAVYAEPAYIGGAIMLVEGKTGRDRLCNDYDATRQRCRAWADGVGSKAKRVSSPLRSKKMSEAAAPSVKVAAVQPAQKLTESLGKPLWLQMIHPEQPAKVEPQKKEVKE